MEHISHEEMQVIRRAHLEGLCIVVIAHCPQEGGGCHPFEFMRGALPDETIEKVYERVQPDILQHIEDECGRSCTCKNGKPVIRYRIFGGR